jgi:hypothetical protein
MYILKVRQTTDLYFIADGDHETLLKAADLGECEDFEFIGEKRVSTMVSSITPYTEDKVKEIESYAI